MMRLHLPTYMVERRFRRDRASEYSPQLVDDVRVRWGRKGTKESFQDTFENFRGGHLFLGARCLVFVLAGFSCQ